MIETLNDNAVAELEQFKERIRILADGKINLQFIINLTEQLNRTEKELNFYRKHLEELVAIRTRELSVARNHAESANQMKSLFLANISHELRTPLNAILGFTQILIQDLHISTGVRKNLEIIERSGQYLLSIINDILEISCIEVGHSSIRNAPFELDEILHDIEDMLRQRAEVKKLQLLFDCENRIITRVWGDAKRLRQVLINLLTNAIKYTDTGSVVLRVICANTEGEEQRIRFEISDTGPGIEISEQDRIFQAFYQTSYSMAKGDGIGLGLTIAYEFVHLMGGELTVKSTLGCGSCFAFTLLLPTHNLTITRPEYVRLLELESGHVPIRILIVDDDQDCCEFMVNLVHRLNVEINVANNWFVAIEQFEISKPQFVWIGMNVQELDVYAAIRAIRALPGGNQTCIVAIADPLLLNMRNEILAAGGDELVFKPLEEKRVLEVMERLLRLRFCCVDKKAVSADVSIVSDSMTFKLLPNELRCALINAAEQLDVDICMEVATKWQQDFPIEIGYIVQLLKDFRFHQILTLCEQ